MITTVTNTAAYAQTKRALCVCAITLIPTIGSAERTIECVRSIMLASGTLQPVGSYTFSQASTGQVSITWSSMNWHEKVGTPETVPSEEILFTHTTNGDTQGDRFSTVGLDSLPNAGLGTPTVYHIDWVDPMVFTTNWAVSGSATSEHRPRVNADDLFDCNRVVQ